MADRDTRQALLKQLREAHEALADKMFAAGTLGEADVAPLVDRVATLHRQLVEHGAKVMRQVRAVATPEQLAKAATTKAKLDGLRNQIHDLLGEPDDDDPPPPQ
jgi:Spy/CpxP family protein refolding chaperone